MHYCTNCGQPVDGAKFCPSCGTAVAAAADSGSDDSATDTTSVIPGIDDLRVGASVAGDAAAPTAAPLPITTPPAAPPPGRTGPSRTFLLVAVIALAVILAGVIGYLFTGASGQQARTSATPSTIATPTPTPTPTPPKPAVTVTKAAPQPTVTVTQPVPVVPQNDGNDGNDGSEGITREGTDCGSGVRAAGPTSCQFALAVRDAYVYSGSSSYLSGVYSPVTGQTYDMYCNSSDYPIRCTGGNDAMVLIY